MLKHAYVESFCKTKKKKWFNHKYIVTQEAFSIIITSDKGLLEYWHGLDKPSSLPTCWPHYMISNTAVWATSHSWSFYQATDWEGNILILNEIFQSLIMTLADGGCNTTVKRQHLAVHT